MNCSHCQNTCSLAHFSPGQISDSGPLNVFMLADDERCQITINPLTRKWSAPLLSSNYMAGLQARGVWTHFVAWWKTIHHGWQSPSAADFLLFQNRMDARVYLSKCMKGLQIMHRQRAEGNKWSEYCTSFPYILWLTPTVEQKFKQR